MAAHQLPGLGLNGNFVDGQDNWGEAMNANLERLTIAVNTSVLGVVANSGALPAEPADGDMWLQTSNGHIRSYDEADDEWMDTTPQTGWRLFREDTLEFFNYIDGVWVAEDSGPSLPAGGTTGQVLAKASGDDGDAEWVDPEAASFPAGTPGQVLTKTEEGVEFADAPDGLPEGGEIGQVLVLGEEGPEWAEPEAAEEGGTWAVVNTTTGALLAGGGCTVERETGSRYNVTFENERPDANYGVLFGGTSGAGGTQPFVVDGSQTAEGFSIICYNGGGTEATPGKLMFQIAGLLPGSEDGGVPPGGANGQVLTKVGGVPAWASLPAPPTQHYRFGSFFTTTPAADEVLMMHAVTDAFNLPANLVGSVWKSGVAPTDTTVFSLKADGVEIGTVTVANTGVATFAAAGGNIAAGTVISLVGPAAANGIANSSFTFKGTQA